MRESDGEMKHEDHVSLSPSCQKGRRTDADATKVDKAAPRRRPRQPKSTQIWARDHGSAALRRQREERDTHATLLKLKVPMSLTEDRIKYFISTIQT